MRAVNSEGTRAGLSPVYLAVGLLACFLVSACGNDETPLDPAASSLAIQIVHEASSDCLSCHPRYGDPKARPVPGERIVLAPKSRHEDYWCWDCHDPLTPTGNLASIHTELWTPYSGARQVVFLNRTGPKSFADGDAVYDGVCEVCHTMTTYHRNNASGSHQHNAGSDCAQCHDHYNFWKPSGGGDCTLCHNQSQPNGAGDYRRKVVGAGGDFVRPSHHVTNGTTTEVVTAGDCAVCHDQSNHQSYKDGVSVYLNNPKGGASIQYNGTASSLEPFCTGCHDGTHTAPFSSGRPARAVPAGWNTSPHKTAGVTCYGEGTAGCHVNGHGSNFPRLLQKQVALADNTSYSTSKYALCWTCHSERRVLYERNKFEDLHKKHVIGEKAPCVTCHGVHAPTDPGEGLIDFSYALNNGFDLQLIGGRTRSTAFWISSDGRKGYCYLTCHGEKHDPEDYDRVR